MGRILHYDLEKDDEMDILRDWKCVGFGDDYERTAMN